MNKKNLQYKYVFFLLAHQERLDLDFTKNWQKIYDTMLEKIAQYSHKNRSGSKRNKWGINLCDSSSSWITSKEEKP